METISRPTRSFAPCLLTSASAPLTTGTATGTPWCSTATLRSSWTLRSRCGSRSGFTRVSRQNGAQVVCAENAQTLSLHLAAGDAELFRLEAPENAPEPICYTL